MLGFVGSKAGAVCQGGGVKMWVMGSGVQKDETWVAWMNSKNPEAVASLVMSEDSLVLRAMRVGCRQVVCKW